MQTNGNAALVHRLLSCIHEKYLAASELLRLIF
ncbi:MAG: hypothetical protein ACI83P_001841 [Janthinobacterium sp.]|jgi:hypothetical protein